MPRPRTIPDEQILDGLERVLHERGPHDFTLGDVARETGLAPATLLQRFGTKRALVEAFARRAAGRTATVLAGAAPGIAGLRKALVDLASPLGQRKRMANSLALLLEDVRDPSLGVAAREHADAMEAAIERHLRAAIASGELLHTDAKTLARTILTAYNGALVLWAIRGKGSIAEAVGAAIDAVVAPYAKAPKRAGRRPAS